MKSGRFEDAAEICREILTRVPDHSGALVMLGTSLARSGQPREGLPFLAKAVDLNPKDVTALVEASTCARLAGLQSEAIDFGRAAVQIEPDRPWALCNLGLALAEAGRPKEGLLQLQKAAQIAPNKPQVLHNLGLVLELCGRGKEALQQFHRAIQLAPQALASRLAAGSLLMSYGNPKAALLEALTCLQQEATNIPALLLAARASQALTLHKDAEEFIERVFVVNPKESAAWVMKGFQLQALGDFSESRNLFEVALELNPLQGAAYWGIRQGSQATEQDLIQVDRILQAAAKLPAGSLERAYAYFAVAKTYSDLAMYQQAMVHYDLANGEAAVAQRVESRYDPEAYNRFLLTCQEIFTVQFGERNAVLANPSDQPIFIVGMMRSGTTLMEQILSSHSEVTAAGEQHYWSALAPSLINMTTHEVDGDRVKSFQVGYLDLLKRYASTGRVTDKMPENARFIGLIKVLFPHAKIIHMSRDMVDVGLSIYATPYEVSPDFAHVQAHIAEACRNHLKLMSFWQSVLPGSYLDVSYSELIDHPADVIRQVLDYCELPWDDACMRQNENERTISTPSVWQVRQPIYSSSKGRWKKFAPYLGELLTLAEPEEHI